MFSGFFYRENVQADRQLEDVYDRIYSCGGKDFSIERKVENLRIEGIYEALESTKDFITNCISGRYIGWMPGEKDGAAERKGKGYETLKSDMKDPLVRLLIRN